VLGPRDEYAAENSSGNNYMKVENSSKDNTREMQKDSNLDLSDPKFQGDESPPSEGSNEEESERAKQKQ